MRGGSEASDWSSADRADIAAIVFTLVAAFAETGCVWGHRGTESTCILRCSSFLHGILLAILAIILLVTLRCGLVWQ